jgi:ferredoxin-NADP reductase
MTVLRIEIAPGGHFQDAGLLPVEERYPRGMPSTTTLELLRSRPEAGNVRTFVFTTGGISWIAGQAQAYVLPQAGPSKDDHERWFTIASAPSEGTINISTRVSQSRFKQALNALEPGDHIDAHSLEGDFTWDEPNGPVVFVAGGIGITPFRSILVERQAKGRTLDATLVYFNRTNDVPFRAELEAMAAGHSSFKLHVVVGDPIDADRILKHAPGSARQTTYLSGPEPMVESVGAALKARGVAVKQDWFPGYDEKTY